jgi:putative N6-adenine-specific DNA methylase
MDEFFASAAPGLETILGQEADRLSLPGWRVEAGGVSFSGDLEAMYRANLHLRTASRVLLRLGSFGAKGFDELRKKAARLEWGRGLKPGQPVTLHVTCHKSRLYHSQAVAERIAGTIGDSLGKITPMVKTQGEEDSSPAQLILVRLDHDQCTISLDSSGELLHRRGYRLETAKAPLRETLAAGMLLASGWDAQHPLLDPFCGSGTIAIEAACMALNIAPGSRRRFAFMEWPGFDRRLWSKLVERSLSTQKNSSDTPIIQASDRDAGAIHSAHANAKRAGVLESIQFACRAFSTIEPPDGPGWVVTNPPYGLRVSAEKDLRNLYAQLGKVLRLTCQGWQAAILCNDSTLLGHSGLKLDTSFSTVNGGVKVRLGKGKI